MEKEEINSEEGMKACGDIKKKTEYRKNTRYIISNGRISTQNK